MVGQEITGNYQIFRIYLHFVSIYQSKNSSFILQMHPTAAKFRKEGFQPEFVEMLDRMFMNTTTTGDHAWTPAFGTIPSEVSNGVEDVAPLESDNESHDSSTKKKFNSKSGEFGSLKRKRERKSEKIGGAVKLSAQIDRLCEAVEKRSAPATTSNDQLDSSIATVMKIVTSLPGVEICSELHLFTTRLFMIKEKREMFMSIEDPDKKLTWLKFEQAERI